MLKRSRVELAVLLTATLSWSCGYGYGYGYEEPSETPTRTACQESVAGVWHGKTYSKAREQWVEFTLTIRQVEGSATKLEGEIVNALWVGPETETVRGPCEGRAQLVVSMDARGKHQNQKLEFYGTRWKLEQELCSDGQPWEYHLDRFTGTVDEDGNMFNAVVSDAGGPDETIVFYRQSCDEQEYADPLARYFYHCDFGPPACEA
jgi:hypothetical protein